MEQKVKLQMSCELEDLNRLCSATLVEALDNVEELSELISEIRTKLVNTKINDLETMKKIMTTLDMVRHRLIKIDNRAGDVAAIVSGIVNAIENPQSVQKDENDNKPTG